MRRSITFAVCAALSCVLLTGADAPDSARAPVALSVAGRAGATPSIAADGRLVAVAFGATTKDNRTDVFVAVSRDAGVTFGAPVLVNSVAGEARLGGELPPRIALSPGGTSPEITVIWTARSHDTSSIKVARSRDGGKSFEAPQVLQKANAAGDRGWPSVVLDSRGVAHAIWLDHRGRAAARTAAGGAAHQHRAGAPHDGAAMAQRSGLYYAAAGAQAPRERQLTPGVCYCCKTAFAANGRTLMAAWRHVYPGNIRDIAFSISRDGGRTFTVPARVSPDQWEINACPDDGPSIAVDRGGRTHVVWPTVINGDAPEGALFHAATRDGKTFTRRLRIPTLGSIKPSHPQIAVAPDGGLVVAWDEYFGGRRIAAVRTLRAGKSGALQPGPALELEDGPIAQYPVVASTTAGVVAAWTSGRPEDSRILLRAVGR